MMKLNLVVARGNDNISSEKNIIGTVIGWSSLSHEIVFTLPLRPQYNLLAHHLRFSLQVSYSCFAGRHQLHAEAFGIPDINSRDITVMSVFDNKEGNAHKKFAKEWSKKSE